MSERDERYWGPYPGEVPLSRASRPAAPPGAEPAADPGAVPAAVPEEPEVERTAAEPEPPRPSAPDPARMAERGPSRVERRRDGNAMVPLLAQALSTQLAKLAADVDPVPDGWWFTPQR